jgi:hypothetical protein
MVPPRGGDVATVSRGVSMKTILATFLAMPFMAHATVVYVDYEGVIASSTNPSYRAGDPLRGHLEINSDLAPPNQWGENSPNLAFYGYFDRCSCVPDFVTGYSDTLSGISTDYVNISRNVQGGGFPDGYDAYQIYDIQGEGTGHRTTLVLAAQFAHFLPDVGLVQSFEARQPVDGFETEGLFGYVETGVKEAKTIARFALSRLSITPTPGEYSCRI